MPLTGGELRLRLRAVAMRLAAAAQQRVGLLLQQGIERITAPLFHLDFPPDGRLLAAQACQIRLYLFQRDADSRQIPLADCFRQRLILHRRQRALPFAVARLHLGEGGFQLRQLRLGWHRTGIIQRLGENGGDAKTEKEEKSAHISREGKRKKAAIVAVCHAKPY